MTSAEEKYPREVQRECRNPACPKENTDPEQLKDCARCMQACYCSRKCQQAHWKAHKKECKACVKQGAKLIAKKIDERDELKEVEFNPRPGRWVMSSQQEAELMNEWKATMTPREMPPGCRNKDQALKFLGITADLVRDLPVGAWYQAMMRREALDEDVNYKNKPPLRKGDICEVLPGNCVKWSSVGQKARLEEYFKKEGKWGVELEDGQNVLVKAGNLKRWKNK